MGKPNSIKSFLYEVFYVNNEYGKLHNLENTELLHSFWDALPILLHMFCGRLKNLIVIEKECNPFYTIL